MAKSVVVLLVVLAVLVAGTSAMAATDRAWMDPVNHRTGHTLTVQSTTYKCPYHPNGCPMTNTVLVYRCVNCKTVILRYDISYQTTKAETRCKTARNAYMDSWIRTYRVF